jgi:hypothetical protein
LKKRLGLATVEITSQKKRQKVINDFILTGKNTK